MPGQYYRPTKHSGQAAQLLLAAGRTWAGAPARIVEPGSRLSSNKQQESVQMVQGGHCADSCCCISSTWLQI
jgi:hypothetical protein